MPRLSDSMEEGTILKWLKAEGDEVGAGDELVEIESDKANMVFEADADGSLIEIVAREGDSLPIGAVIARLGNGSEAPAEPAQHWTASKCPVRGRQGERTPGRSRRCAVDHPRGPRGSFAAEDLARGPAYGQ